MSKVILLADDSPDDELFFRDSLKSCGLINPIHVVRDGREAISYLNGEGPYADRNQFPYPGALFLDLVMPVADGWVVLQWLQSHPPQNEMVIIVLTGQTQRDRLQDAYNLGAQSFLLKPLQKVEIEGLIKYLPGPWQREPEDPSHLPKAATKPEPDNQK